VKEQHGSERTLDDVALRVPADRTDDLATAERPQEQYRR